MKRILVLDGYIRNSVAIVRSLGKAGYPCDILVQRHANGLYAALQRALRSKHAKRVFEVSGREEKSLIEEVLRILSSGEYSCVIAGGTFYSNFLSRNKQVLSPYAHVLMEDYSKVSQVHNKESCMELAARIGVNTPGTYRAYNSDDLKIIAEKTKGKVIVKFNDSYASKGLVKYDSTPEFFVQDYVSKFGFDHSDDNFPLIQQYIDGDLIDSTSFSVDGDPKAILTQKREMTAWLEGGGGIVNITNDVQSVKHQAAMLLRHLHWTGHVEMDWIREHDTGKCFLIEINPKFWGTTQLTISAGFNYPLWYVKLVQSQPIDYPEQYTLGLRYRWLNDELVAIMTQPKTLASFFKELLKSLRRYGSSNTRANIFWADLKPTIMDFIDASVLILAIWTGRKKV
ncbi:MAG: hypothetical protein Salg2KO_07860 [Salibacteraceae bacterium]